MLVSSNLSHLGHYLRSKTPEITTKGVDSVRSPVTNLSSIRPHASHASFIQHVAASFGHAMRTGDLSLAGYRRAALNGDVVAVMEEVWEGKVLTGMDERADKVRRGMDEMKTWDWVFGQTPEFSITLSGTMSFGNIKMNVSSKHGVITSCETEAAGADGALREALSRMDTDLVGQRYDSEHVVRSEDPRIAEVVQWLQQSV
ncbi:hypothetical protein NliqN6_1618 [Naganishia liquefaciens]|uniref:Putative lipoate-protein ligase A n=1 Tax=Naganishia liquefaciens TaxID=104408 RepID=A0A8H3TPY5_9TREE|nr:hypothetical protein NliqN6_1618 [Naganishia liquefaciens]